MAKAKARDSALLNMGKLARQLAVRRTRARRRKLKRKSLEQICDLPEHIKRDIGWLNG